MDSARWEKIRSLFEAALEVDTAERSRFLSERCGDDPELRREIESLLAADDDPDDLLGGHAVDALPMLKDHALVGRRVGPWRIVQELGVGGMGAVYLAERAEGDFEQTVALKLIKRGMDSDVILRRFEDERRILAQLEHPNIARLLDGGMTEDGRPWFTMEHVAGLPIDRYCDERRLPIERRLDLFRTVCSAVHHAHRNLVVHRDLKPSNVLVTEDGIVKLLDFGIAKVLGEGEGGSAVTRTGLRAMTPAYASPEQVRGQPVTTASDVYSLGVMLYEILCGRRPYRVEDTSPQALEKSICTTVPERPSRAVDREDESRSATPDSIGTARSTTAAHVRRDLSGDLDNICLVALRKESDRRYGSVEALSEDIHRHLRGLPVTARTDTAGYRFQKFVGRNRVAMSVAALVFVLVTGLVAFYTYRLAEERDRAQVAARKAERVSDFLSGLFQVSDPRESGGGSVTAREILDRGASRLEQDLEEEPEVLATMANVMGEVYRSLGLYEESGTWLERSAALHDELSNGKSADAVENQHRLAVLQYETGNAETARVMMRETLAARRALLGNEHPLVALSCNDLGRFLTELDSLDTAEGLHREALKIRRAAFGDRSREVAESLSNIGVVHFHRSEIKEAERLYRQVLEIRREVLGEHHALVALSLNNIGTLLEQKGDVEGADEAYRQAIATERIVLGDDHPERAVALTNLARLLGSPSVGRYDEAIELLGEAVELERLRGESHSYVAYALKELAKVLRGKGDYEEAERAFQEALAIYDVATPDGGMYVASTQVNYGRLLLLMGRPEDAAVQLQAGAATYASILPPDAVARVRAEISWGRCLVRLGRYEEAEVLLRSGHRRVRERFGEGSSAERGAAEYLVELYGAWGLPDRSGEIRTGAAP